MERDHFREMEQINFPKRGEVYVVVLDPTIGSEIGKSRPALVISNDINNENSDTVTVIPITSKITKAYPFEVLINKEEAGLSEESKIKCNQIRTVDKKRLIKKIGTLTDRKMKEVERAILIHLGIERI